MLDYLYSKYLVWRLKSRAPVLFEVIPFSSHKSELTRAADHLGSDKGSNFEADPKLGWPAHTYTEFYHRQFKARKNQLKNILECGIGTNNLDVNSTMGIRGTPGASLRLWRQYFPKANVVGVDIDGRILFQEERIETFQLDQTDGLSTSALLENLGRNYDLIVDDGLHTFEAGASFFEAASPFLARDGMYVIEDVTEQDATRFFKYFKASPYSVDLIRLRRGRNLVGDNQLICITHPDV